MATAARFRSRGAVSFLAALAVGACGTTRGQDCHSRPATADAGQRSPGEPPLRLVGRFDPPGGAPLVDGAVRGTRFAWSGSSVEVRFTGSSLTMRLRAAQLDGPERSTAYTVRVDDHAPITLEISAKEERYELASNLDPVTPHEVTVMREAEAFAGVHELLGLELARGGAFLPPRPRARRIEIVGDSITCGYGVMGADPRCGFSYATERASAAYGARLARALDADVTTVCWSGRGVLRNYDGSTKGTMPELFELTLPEGKTVPWAFTTPAPQVVIVNLGTNDFFGDGGNPLDLPTFEATYLRFVRRLASVYPGTWILVATSPMLGEQPTRSGTGTVAEVARASLARVVERRVREGDSRIELVTLPTSAPHWGCDGHPDAAMNARMAEVLEPVVRSRLPR